MSSAVQKPGARPEPEPNPDVCRGDHVYFQHKAGPQAAKVLCTGKHGIHVEHGGKPHKVRWEHVLGHKKRASQKYNVLDEGEDGLIVEDAAGQRRYLNIPPEARGEKMVLEKSFGAGGARLVVFAKAGPLKNRPGLHVEQKTDKNGVATNRWVRSDKGMPSDDQRGAAQGYGTHNLERGDKVKFRNGEHEGAGTIHTIGEHGAVVHDAAGGQHRVLHHQITGHEPGGAKKPATAPAVTGEQKPIAPDQFDATSYAKSHDQADITPDAILANFPPDTASKISDVQKRLASIEQTIDRHMKDGAYSEERSKLHQKIFESILGEERINAATPPEGEAPTFTILGGRGGSGKSWFDGKVYDHAKSIVLDADHIKGMLPEYEGWNAAEVHSESSDVLEAIMSAARHLGCNVVLDSTMKTAAGAIQKVEAFKKAGYRTEAHYMHLPRQEAAKRAVSRFLGKTQRYVPVEVVLANTSNEASFDQVKGMVDKWSFRDNNVPQGSEPKLISESGNDSETNGAMQDGNTLRKSDQSRILFIWKR
jgi:predicted ABC-type ATPase